MTAEQSVKHTAWGEVVARIVRRASSLDERLAHPASANTTIADGDEGAARWAAWREEVAGGSDELMVRRLSWDGLSVEEARRRLGEDGPAARPDEDEWVRFLEELGEVDTSPQLAGSVREGVETAGGVPFATAYAPFLSAAAGGVEPAIRSLGGRLEHSVVAGMLDGLVRELARLGGRVLGAAFGEFSRAQNATPDPTKTSAYRVFTSDLGTPAGWVSVLTAHPALARLLAKTCVSWVADTSQFLTRLQADWEELPALFSPGIIDCPDLQLLGLRSGLSDRHGGTCAVRVLEFSTGHRLVYKARSLELEAAFHDLLRSLAAQGMADSPPSLRVLVRAGYGWIEHADATPVPDREALEEWFRKAGGLLCLMYLLGGNDGHMENIIATSGGPVLIDVETLLQPRRTSADHSPAGTFAEAARRVQDSVLHTGLLSFWQQGRNGWPYDIGGFTGTGGYESPVLHQTWEHIGTDAMRLAWRRATARGLLNLPVLEGSRHAAGAHLPALVEGFSTAWRFLQTHRDPLASALPQWAGAPLRVLIRPTTHCAALIERSLAVDALKSGLDRSIIFEALRRPMVRHHRTLPAYWPAVTEEIRALEAGDIPIFYVKAGGRDLETADGRCLVPQAFGESAVDSTAARLDRLTDANCQRQVELIAAAFIENGATASLPPAEAAAAPVDIDALLATTPLASDAGLIATAEVLGKQILQAAIRGRDGFVTWLAPSCLHPGRSSQQGVSYYLYDGAAGIALFLAALARVTDNELARSSALAALEPVRAVLDDPNATALIQREGIGGCSGLGSLVYSLTVIAGLLDAPELIERASRVSQYIDTRRIAADQALDIVGGSAGAILALLALHRVGGGDDALQRAVACGRHLLARAERVGEDALAWPSWPDRLLLAGYSHGAAGMATALTALFQATGDPDFRHVAQAALRYERGLFDRTAGNWPVLLPSGGSRLAATWCHGAPGVLLSRTGMLGVFCSDEDARLREEMAVGAQTTVAAGLSTLDHLCCGTIGRVEILHTVAPELGGRYREIARLGATLTIQRARQRRYFSLQPDPVRNAVFQPGFFRGLSGLGYSFLRLARPDLLPSLLAWQATPSPIP